MAASCQLGGRELPLYFCIFMAPLVLGVLEHSLALDLTLPSASWRFYLWALQQPGEISLSLDLAKMKIQGMGLSVDTPTNYPGCMPFS